MKSAIGYPVPFDLAVHACATPQYVAVPNVGVFGPYAAGIPPIVRMPSGRNGIQVEEAVTNSINYSKRQDLWVSDIPATVSGPITDPLGGDSAYEIRDTSVAEAQYIKLNLGGFTPGAMNCLVTYIKYADWQYYLMLLRGSPIGDLDVRYDLLNNIINNINATYAGMVSLGGWRLVYLMGAGNASLYPWLYPARLTDLNTLSNVPIGSIYCWETSLVSNCHHIPSIITVPSTTPVTKPKSELYFPAAKIPAMLRKKFTTPFQFYFSEAMPVSERCLWEFDSCIDVILDGDMEEAGTNHWPAGPNSLITKSLANPQAGLQALEVTKISGVFGASTYQDVLTVGKTYYLSGYARSDGVSTPFIQILDGDVLWTGTTSTDWQYFDVSFVATDPRIMFYIMGIGGGFDSIKLLESTEKIRLVFDPADKKFKVVSNLAGTLVQSAAVTFSPWQEMSIFVDANTGKLTLADATTGNGTVLGSSWDVTDGDLYWGCDSALAKQANGVVGEPVIAWA